MATHSSILFFFFFPHSSHLSKEMYSCLENPMDGEAWWGYSPQGHKESEMTERLNQSRYTRGFPGSSDSEKSDSSVGDMGLTCGLGRCPGEGSGSLLQYSCLENPMDRRAWWATAQGVTKSQT